MDQIISNINLLIAYPTANLSIIIDGIMIGALFALAAYGLALVWGVMNVKNLAQGDFVIGGGYISWWLVNNVGIHPFVGIPIAAIVMALLAGALHGSVVHRWALSQRKAMIGLSIISFLVLAIGVYIHDVGSLFGMEFSPAAQDRAQSFAGFAGIVLTFLIIVNGGIYNLVISRVLERDLFTSLLSTFGLAIMMAQIMNLLFGSDTQSLDLNYSNIDLAPGVSIPVAKLVGAAFALLLAGFVILFMRNSRMGQAIRATAQDARAARVLGIDTEKVYAFTFSLNAAICGAAGAIIVMIWVIQPFYGITYSIRAFVIVTAAGLGNLPGVIAAGLGLGAAEQYGGFIFGIQYQQAIAVMLLILVLIYRLMQQRKQRQVLQ
ncbi:MAG: branched-chain amino acid ABC transporter permease [Rhizobiaceae bacterium]